LSFMRNPTRVGERQNSGNSSGRQRPRGMNGAGQDKTRWKKLSRDGCLQGERGPGLERGKELRGAGERKGRKLGKGAEGVGFGRWTGADTSTKIGRAGGGERSARRRGTDAAARKAPSLGRD